MKTVEIIKELMAEQGVNQTQLAERSGIAFGTLNRILNEKQSLQPNTLQKIAIALGISTFELLDEADSYPLLNNQVNGYLEFGGEIKRIRSFTELEVWVKRVKPLVGELPNRAKSIIRDNNKNSKLILSQSSAIHNFNDIDLCKMKIMMLLNIIVGVFGEAKMKGKISRWIWVICAQVIHSLF